MSGLDDIKKMFAEKPVEKQEPVKEPEPEKPKPIENENTKFSREERNEHIKNTLQRFKDKKVTLRRREKKMIKNAEYDSIKSTQGTVVGLAVVGLIFLMIVREFLPNEAMYAIIIIVGTMMFIPVGMIVGWITFDPVMRCKILRKVSKTNYGIVNFVGKGRRMVSKIKNFDYGLIWQGDLCWVLTRDKVYQQTKDGNAANEGYVIDPDSVVTLVDTVPVIFVDMDSMEPLSIVQSGRTPVYPSEIGPACKAWMDIQRAKLLSHKKMGDTLLMIVIIAAVAAVVISFITMSKVEELTEMVKALQQSIAQTPP